MRVQWLGGPKDGLVEELPGNADSIVVALEPNVAELLDLTAAAKPISGQRLRVPIRAGYAVWAERESLT